MPRDEGQPVQQALRLAGFGATLRAPRKHSPGRGRVTELVERRLGRAGARRNTLQPPQQVRLYRAGRARKHPGRVMLSRPQHSGKLAGYRQLSLFVVLGREARLSPHHQALAAALPDRIVPSQIAELLLAESSQQQRGENSAGLGIARLEQAIEFVLRVDRRPALRLPHRVALQCSISTRWMTSTHCLCPRIRGK